VATLNSVSLQYDGFGRRTKNLQNTSFLFDGANAVQELSGSTPTANLISGGIDEIFTRADSAGAFTPLKDALGSTIALVDASGNVVTSYAYDPFGNTTVSGAANANGVQYTGRENELNGLYYLRARYFSPLLHRFISPDPIGFRGGDVNLYGYALDSPTNFVDLSGLNIMVIENGPTGLPPNNPFGHTAVAVSDAGLYSFGNGFSPGTSTVGYLLYEAQLRDSVVYIIHTTPEQDAAALALLRKFPHTFCKHCLLKDNCSTRSNQALDAAGIPRVAPLPGMEVLRTDVLDEFGITPGSAGNRAVVAGADIYPIPKGTTVLPGALVVLNHLRVTFE
jgi:RHS repeat-associated protein